MDGNFEISKTNHVSFQKVQFIADSTFRAWAQFLNTHPSVGYALSTYVELNVDMLQELYCRATDTSDNNEYAFSCSLPGGRTFRVTERDVNQILHFPTDNFVHDPTTEEIHAFFRLIHSQQEDFFVGEIHKSLLPKHWKFFFHTLIHVFTAKETNLNGIPSFLQKIGYAVANNRRINFGRIVLGQIILWMGPLEDRTLTLDNVLCLYPRFLQLIFNAVLTDNEKEVFMESEIKRCMIMRSNTITQLIKRDPFPEVPTVITQYMSTVPLPLIPPGQAAAAGEQAGILPIPIAPIVHMNVDPVVEPSVAVADHEVEHQQPLSPVEEPFIQPTEPLIQSPTPSIPPNEPIPSVEGDSALAAPHKEKPTSSSTLPPRKRKRTKTEASVETVSTTSLTSIMDIAQVNWPSLSKSTSQPINPPLQKVLTEATVVHSISRSESMAEDSSKNPVPSQASAVELPTSKPASESSILRTDSLVVDSSQDQVPSQAFGGNKGKMPISDPLSTPHGGTFQVPLRDFTPSVGVRQSSGVSFMSESDKPDEASAKEHLPSQATGENQGFAPFLGTHPFASLVSTSSEPTTLDPKKDSSLLESERQLAASKVWELRTPIAPPVTPSRAATVISHAGTFMALSDTPTELVSVHPKPQVRRKTLSVDDLLPRTDLELHTELTMKEMPIHDKERKILQSIPLKHSFASRYLVEAASGQVDDQLKAIMTNIQLAVGSASGTIIGTKQSVDALRKDTMEEILETRSDIREMRDLVLNDVHEIHHSQLSLSEDALVIRDGQVTVKDAMNRLSNVESHLNRRLGKLEQSTNVRLDNVDLRLDGIDHQLEYLGQLLDNQNDAIQAIFSMFKNQEASRTQQPPTTEAGTSSQPPIFNVDPSNVDDSSTKGENAVQETQQQQGSQQPDGE